MRLTLSILFSLVNISLLYAFETDPKNEYRVVKDLRSEILVYDPEFSSYVPYNSEIHSGTNFITIRLDSSIIEQYSLVTYVSKGTAIFFDNKLYNQYFSDGWITLKEGPIKTSRWVTIFNSNGILPFNKIFYGFSIDEKIPQKIVVNKLEARPTFNNIFHNFYIIVFILILISLAISKVFNHKAYNEFYNIRRNTLAIGKDQNYIFKKPLNSNNLLSLLIHCQVFVFIFFIIQYFTNGWINLPLFNSKNTLRELLLNYFTFTAIAFIVYIVKFILIAFISYLYNVKEYKLAHYFNYVKLSMVFYITILPIISLIYLWYDRLNEMLVNNLVMLALIGFSIIKIIIISYNLNKIRQFRNLYLFSYLCATEIIPLFIVFKLLV